MPYLIGAAGGFVSGFFGSGGGLIIVPALVHLLKVDEYKARGTTLATILLCTLVAAIFYSKFDYFNWQISIKAVTGGVIGGFIGAKIIKKIPEEILSVTFNIFLIVMAVRMIIWG